MRARSRRSWRVLAFGLVGLLCLAALKPVPSHADTNLEIGGQAHIADANGDNVRLRTGPGYDNTITTLYPEGTTVDVLDGPFTADDGSVWYKISVDGDAGYMDATYLVAGAGDNSASSDNTSSGGDTATVTTGLNLRTDPSFAASVITVMPAGATVTLTGDSENGFLSVDYDGMSGWAFNPYLDNAAYTGDTLGNVESTTDAVNLRAGPSTDDAVLQVVPAGTTVTLTGDSANGFVSVDINGTDGWMSADYLGSGASSSASGSSDTSSGSSSSSSSESTPASGGSEIIWPMASGSGPWEITQGYDGPIDHQDWSSTWAYYYSFDLVQANGNTTGQPVYSPVNGTIRWIDTSYGGMSIDMGNGYAFAYFHTDLAPGLAAGQSVAQGQYLGTIAGPGDGGNGGFPHLHITLWQTSDGGNWDRHDVPFTGEFAISGDDFPDTGGANQYYGAMVYP